MDPCELNLLVNSIANLLYTTLTPEEFIILKVLIAELSKSMFSLEVMRGVCNLDRRKIRLGESLAAFDDD